MLLAPLLFFFVAMTWIRKHVQLGTSQAKMKEKKEKKITNLEQGQAEDLLQLKARRNRQHRAVICP